MIGFEPMSTRGSNEGGWKYSDLRTQLNSSYLDMLPADLRNQIVEVNKSTNNTGKAYDSSLKTFDVSCVTTTPDKLWLPSYTEIVGIIDNETPDSTQEDMAELLNAEGSQYQLYADLGVSQTDKVTNAVSLNTADNIKVPGQQNQELHWTRTPNPVDSNYAYTVNNLDGTCNESHTVAYRYGIAPCFCI